MISFLFWNIKKNNSLQESINRITSNYEVDILMLAECSIEPYELLNSLNQDRKYKYHYAPSIGCKKILIFTRFSNNFIRPLHDSNYFTIRHLKLPGLKDILLVINHFPSKSFWRNSSQALECFKFANSIRSKEEEIGHSRTILVGDLNMNPFEDGLIGASGLHSVMSRQIAKKRTRIVQNEKYPFFYNPMWNLFGDETPGPPGTYYYSSSEQNVFFWNMYDQVLIRPDLLDYFKNDELKILESDGNISFLNSQGNPDINAISDHLPLFFKLKL
ncbi:MAG: hypothetical protein KAI43_10365 [Candidatus Aureabacteria bacterium]|nr:hypothetical protein [Candidatus Auribacterota bacterium]